MSENGQTHFKNLAALAAKFLKCVWLLFNEIIKDIKRTHKCKVLNSFKVIWKTSALDFSGISKKGEGRSTTSRVTMGS